MRFFVNILSASNLGSHIPGLCRGTYIHSDLPRVYRIKEHSMWGDQDITEESALDSVSTQFCLVTDSIDKSNNSSNILFIIQATGNSFSLQSRADIRKLTSAWSLFMSRRKLNALRNACASRGSAHLITLGANADRSDRTSV